MIIDPYKRIKDNKCFYSDTDSVFLQYPLSEKFVGSELGQMKQESLVSKGVFISPKVYGYVNENNKSVIKIKGFNDCSHITLDQLSQLQDTSLSNISIPYSYFKRSSTQVFHIHSSKMLSNTIYNKRDVIVKNGIIVDTKPKYIKIQSSNSKWGTH